MTKPKTLEQLRTEKERAETQLAQEQHKLEETLATVMANIINDVEMEDDYGILRHEEVQLINVNRKWKKIFLKKG